MTLARRALAISAFAKRDTRDASTKGVPREKKAASLEAAYLKRTIYLCWYCDILGRSNGLKGLNLGRSIDHACKCFQHAWVDVGVVSFCVGFVIPQTDGNRVQAARIR